MHTWMKLIWTGVTIFSAASLLWFLLGSTANFQRSLDVVSTFTLIWVGIPSLIMTVFSIRLQMKGWSPSGGGTYAGLFIAIALLCTFSVVLIQSVHTEGWLTERVTSDTLKVTADKKYEYRIDLINLFQKNSYVRLYLENVSTGEEMNIPIDIDIGMIGGYASGEVNHWVTLEPTDIPTRYILQTTKDFPVRKERFTKFDIDIVEGTSKRLE